MEALFSTTLASYEAWLMVLCVIVFFGIYLFDGISFVQRVYAALRPAKPQGTLAPLTIDNSVPEVISPILEPIAPEEIEAHEAEKAKAEEKHEQKALESQVFEEKVLEDIKEQEKIDEAEQKKEVTEEQISKIGEAPIMLDGSVVESTEVIQEGIEMTVTPTEESEEVIENDLEEKEKIEEELLEVAAEKAPAEESIPTGETSSIDTVEESEDTIEENAIEIESELQEEAQEEGREKVEAITEDEFPAISDEEILESQDIPQEQESIIDREKAEEKTDTIKTSDDSEAASEEISTTEESPTLPITVSIPETKVEAKKSNESQYSERLYTIVSEVKTLLARGLAQDARALIIQGLALDKNHRELNLILGSIYESERQAQKAEYIYKDLALVYPEDGEILERLANILIIEKRYDLALEIYKKIISLSSETEGSLYIMTHLAHELGHHEELYAYARRYQKNWPNNPDILTLLAQAEIALGERQAAIQTLIKLKNLTPYNNEIMETIAKLTMEEELAGNFGGEKI